MAIQLQLRRGNTTQQNAFTGAEGELSIDTTTNQIRVHDGSTQGGHIVGASSSSLNNYMTVANTQALFSGLVANVVSTANLTVEVAGYMTVANTQALHNSVTANLNSYIANTNPRITTEIGRVDLLNTNLTSTNNAIRVLVSDRMQVANTNTLVNDRMQVANTIALVNDRMQVANTIALVNDRMQVANTQALHTSVTANLNSYIANTNPRISNLLTSVSGTNTAIRTLVSDRMQVANTQALHTSVTANLNSYIANTNPRIASNDTDISNLLTSVSGTNTAIRTLVSDRMQVANTIALANARLGATASVTLTGDVTAGSTSFSSNTITISTTIPNDTVTGAKLTDNITIAENLVVSGNLIVSGTQTTVDSNIVNINDAIITLNADETGTPSENAGIEVERGTSPNVQFVWDEANDRWTTGSEDIALADNGKLVFGTGDDLQIYHDGSNSFIEDVGTGNFLITTNGNNIQLMKGQSEQMLVAKPDGAVELYHDNVKKLETSAAGAIVTGTVTADGLDIQGDGAISGGSRLTISDIADVNNDGIRLDDNTTSRYNNLSQDTSGNFVLQHYTGSAWQNNLTITSGGSVGIGSSSPSYKLDVVGNARLNPTSNPVLRFSENGTLRGLLTSSSSIGLSAETSGTLPFIVQTNGTERLRVDGSGNLLVGTTTEGIADYGDTLTLADSDNCGMTIRSGTSSEGNVYFSDGTSGDAEYKGIVKYDHSTDAMSFWSNSLRRMTLDSSGNLLVGKTADNVATVGIEARATGPLISTRDGSDALRLNRLNSDGEIIQLRKDGTVAGEIGSFDSGANIYIGSGDTGVTFNPTVDGILPHNPSTNAQRDNAIDLGYPTVRFKDGYFGGQVLAQFFTGVGDTDTYMDISSNPANTIKFFSGGSEKARFASDGNLYIAKTSDTATGVGLTLSGGGFIRAVRNETIGVWNRQGSDGTVFVFARSNSGVGSIDVTTSGTTYNTTSDRRLKQDIEPLAATDKLMAMNPVSYNWKSDPDGQRSMGFIAQEMQEVMPEAVSTGDDDMMSMDYGRITPILVSALQDAHRKIEQLEQRLADMEAK